jgi:hypothetical protein
LPNRFLARRRLVAFVAAVSLGMLRLMPLPACAASAGASGGAASSVGNQGYHVEDTATHVRIVGAARLSGDDDELTVTVGIDPGFHINANPASSEYLIPTALNIAELPALRITYPAPARFKPKFTNETIDVYDGTILITAFFPKGALSSFTSLHGSLIAQACTDQFCLPPAEIPLLAK